MAGTSQAGGRAAQKARTRAAIVEAARRLSQPSVEQAADAAGVSRATAYRYFPTQEALEVEVGSIDYWSETEALVGRLRSPSIEARLHRLIDSIVDRVTSDERQVRTVLRVYHDTWLRDGRVPNRRGRRMEWIDAVIAPLPAAVRGKLRHTLALAIGPDQVVMLKDVARLDAAETRRVLKSAASALLHAAVAEAEAKSPAAAGGPG
jgi:AcrR family transcriptional regulator